MNLLSFDIEIYNDLPEGNNRDLSDVIPSIGAFCTTADNVEFYYDDPYMSKETAQQLVLDMLALYENDFVPFTWNGLSFDLNLLATYSGMIDECSYLALNHIDGMFLIVAHRGFMLGLDAALKGANLETKTHSVELNDKTLFTEMSGAKAPELWRNREFEAVKTYLKGDVTQPLKLAKVIEQIGGIK